MAVPPSAAAGEDFTDALRHDDPDLLYDRAPCGYLTTDPEGRILKANQTFLSLTGYTHEALVGGRTFSDLLTAGGRIYHETHYAPMLRLQGIAREIALEVVTTTGARLPVLVNAVLDRDQLGNPSLIRIAVFDATERRRYEAELLHAKKRAEESEARARALATTLQNTLIPPLPPDVPGLDVAAAYRAAGAGTEVGGDFYDVFEVAKDDWVVALGDVCGKGVDAAVVSALVRHTVRAVSVKTPEPAAALDLVDDVLLRQGTDRFCTLLLMRLRRTSPRGPWAVTVASGGHPPPLLVREDSVRTLGVPGTLIGALPGGHRADTTMVLEPGDALLLHTDGVTEARQGQRFYEQHRLTRLVATRPGSAAEMVSTVLDDVLAFQQGDPRDDVALVAVRVPPEEPSAVATPEVDVAAKAAPARASV